MTVTGIKLNFSGKEVRAVAGKKVLPHRTDLIKKKMDTKDYDGLLNIFFNFHVNKCNNECTMQQCKIEFNLFEDYEYLYKNNIILITDHEIMEKLINMKYFYKYNILYESAWEVLTAYKNLTKTI